MLILKRPWTRQPQVVQPLKAEFAASCKALLVGSNKSLVGSSVFTYPSSGVSVYGKTVANTGLSTFNAIADSSAVIPTGTEFTMVYINTSGGDTTSPDFSIGTPGSATHEFNAYLRYGTSNAYFRWAGSTSNVTSLDAAAPRSTGVWVLSTGPEGMQIWLDGRLIASNAATPNRTASSLALTVGSGSARTVSVPLLATFAKQYPKARNRELSINPFGTLFQPRRIHIPTAAAAAGVPTLSASTYVAGSLSSTGWRPQITAS